MKRTIKTNEFADTFYSNLPADQKKANNDWLEQMGKMTKSMVSPDNSYPMLTQIEDGVWEYDDSVGGVFPDDIERFLIFGKVKGNKVNWSGRKELSVKQRAFLHDVTKALRQSFDKVRVKEGDLTACMYHNESDFMCSVLSGIQGKHEEAMREYQEVFDQ